jgi:hypothetical protein
MARNFCHPGPATTKATPRQSKELQKHIIFYVPVICINNLKFVYGRKSTFLFKRLILSALALSCPRQPHHFSHPSCALYLITHVKN